MRIRRKPTTWPYGEDHEPKRCNDRGISSFNLYFGVDGREAPQSAYTYAVELSLDEAVEIEWRSRGHRRHAHHKAMKILCRAGKRASPVPTSG